MGIVELTKRADGESVWGHSGGIHGFHSQSGGTVGGNFVLSANINTLEVGISTSNPYVEIFRAAFSGIDKP
ncbi:hypothetical protein [Paenibacillus alvei]|uniref:hypothetical protein n=1 Tax=Paenibacillus alvei TaxID=44250 RepID=UPI001EE63898|nr:hypothetical protein [Paenibacillus alvei]